jgi:AbrB family looped-hinge helix DNA binding protein
MKLTSKGQLTVPKKLREKFGLGTNTEVDVIEDGNALRIVKKSGAATAADKVYGILGRRSSTDKLIESIRGR